MTFEKRMERLKRRHEATMRVLKVTAMENRRMAAENKERDKRLGEIMEGIARLLHTAEMHRPTP